MERAGTVLVLVWQPVETVAPHSALPPPSRLPVFVTSTDLRVIVFELTCVSFSFCPVKTSCKHRRVLRIWNVVLVFCPYFGVQVQVSVRFKEEIYDLVSQLRLL